MQASRPVLSCILEKGTSVQRVTGISGNVRWSLLRHRLWTIPNSQLSSRIFWIFANHFRLSKIYDDQKGIKNQTGRNFIFLFFFFYNRLLVSRRECFNKDSSSISGWKIIPFTEIPWPFANGIMSYTLRVQFDETNGEDRTAARQVAREISARVRRSIEPAVRYGSLGN